MFFELAQSSGSEQNFDMNQWSTIALLSRRMSAWRTIHGARFTFGEGGGIELCCRQRGAVAPKTNRVFAHSFKS